MKTPKTSAANGTEKGLGEAGVASFLVTLVMMVVITLIVLGFAHIARQTQRESLDDQLSTQAFYAAETGVNLVQDMLKTAPSVDDIRKTTCAATGPYLNAQLNDAVTQVANSCLLVDTAPTTLVYGDVGSNSKVIPLQPDNPVYGYGTLKITWVPQSPKPTDNMGSCAAGGYGYGTFPVQASINWPANCPVGVLRFDMVDVSAAGELTAQNLQNQTMTVFAPPTTAGHLPVVKKESPVITYAPGNVVCGSLSDPDSCTLTINNVNFNDTNYLRLSSLYKDVTVSEISGTAHGVPVHFVNAQIAIDSTGKATDVLRRIQVRLDQAGQLSPSYAIQSTGTICKLYFTDGTSTGSLDTSNCPLP